MAMEFSKMLSSGQRVWIGSRNGKDNILDFIFPIFSFIDISVNED